ncbi:MAG: type II toxin-antitoxin system Phd/YefM family antitoxin [Candidatus Dormibacteraceae bacterium]
MARTIAQRELRNDNARIIDAVESGQTFVVTRHGIPVAEIRPLRPGRRKFVPKEDFIKAMARLPAIDATQFRADQDASIDQYVDL